MLPLILAPAALIALAPQPAVQGPVVEGLVVDQAGKPLPASLGLIPMFQRDEPFPAKTVENVIPKNKKMKPGFKLPIPAPGLYLLDVRARGCRPFQVPVLLGEEGLKDLELSPVPDKPKGEVKPISPDPKVVKLEAQYAAQKEREINYRKAIKARFEQKKSGAATDKGSPLDWATDLETVASDLKNETDGDVQSLAAVSYLELGSMMAKLDPETAGLALDTLPATSPWWSFNPRVAGSAFASAGRSADWSAFREALAKDNPDPEVRAYGLYSQAASAYNKGDKEKFTTLKDQLSTEYKATKFGKSAKTFDPAKMPPPSAAPELAPIPETPAPAPAAAPEVTPAPAPDTVPAPSPEPAPAPAS